MLEDQLHDLLVGEDCYVEFRSAVFKMEERTLLTLRSTSLDDLSSDLLDQLRIVSTADFHGSRDVPGIDRSMRAGLDGC